MKLFIPLPLLLELQGYIQLAPGEIAGLGRVVPHEGEWMVTEIFLLDQEAGPYHSVLDPEAVSRLVIDVVERGGDPLELRLWWHSHSREPVFWSDTDVDTLDIFDADGLFSVVMNKRGDALARYDVYRPERKELPLELHILFPEGSRSYREWHADLEDRVEAVLKTGFGRRG